jgi:hypothetical protein
LTLTALFIYLVLGLGVWIGSHLSHLNEDPEPALAEVALALLLIFAWPWAIWADWRAAQRRREDFSE